MSRERRRALVSAFRERKARPGIFAIRCVVTGEVWVQSAANLDTRQAGIWFALRQGSHPNPAMQASWTAHGEAAFAFEALEAVEAADLSPGALADRLKTLEARWRSALAAGRVAG